MGTLQPINPPGGNCTLCWGPGKPIAPLPTPRFVRMSLHDMLPGDNYDSTLEALLLTPHVLDQSITPCDWDIRDGFFQWNWRFDAGVTECHVISGPPARNSFTGHVHTECLLRLPNLSNSPVAQVMYGGYAILESMEGPF